MTWENGCINDSQILHPLDLQVIIYHFSQCARAYQMILRADMVLDVLDPLCFGIETCVLRGQFTGVERLRNKRMFCYLFYPLHTGCEDLCIDFVPKIAWVDLRRCQGVGTLDVHGSPGQWVLEADQQRHLLLPLRWRSKKLCLVGALAYIEATGYTKGLQDAESWISQLINDDLKVHMAMSS